MVDDDADADRGDLPGGPSAGPSSGHDDRAADSDDGYVLAVVRGDPAEGGRWEVYPLPTALLDNLDQLIAALSQQQGTGGVMGLIDVADDFFVVVRVSPPEGVRLLLSDATAATEFRLARQVYQRLVDGPVPQAELADVEEAWPVGDLGIFSDLGLSAMELGAILADVDLYADEMLADIAARLGFEDAYEAALASVSSP